MSIVPTTPPDPIGRCPACGAAAADPRQDGCAACGRGSWFDWEDEGGVQVLRPRGDMLHVDPVEAFVQAFTPRPDARLVVDLVDVQYISSAALSKLLALRKRVLSVNGRIALRRLHPDLWEVLHVTRLDSYFEVDD